MYIGNIFEFALSENDVDNYIMIRKSLVSPFNRNHYKRDLIKHAGLPSECMAYYVRSFKTGSDESVDGVSWRPTCATRQSLWARHTLDRKPCGRKIFFA
jgi:hypothetical protein